jgi:Subtilase family
MTGSSFAAPRVAGMLARLLSIHPGIEPLQAKCLLQRIATPLPVPP